MSTYKGRVTTMLSGDRNGFIGLGSITKGDGSAHDLLTTHDVYVHQDDLSATFRVDMELSFEVVPDTVRGGDALRADDVTEVLVGELVLADSDTASSRALADPRSLYANPTPAQAARMKHIAPEAIDQVIANRPMPSVPRISGAPNETAAVITRRLLERIFPQFQSINESNADMADNSFDEIIAKAITDHANIGMRGHAEEMRHQAGLYKSVRTVLQSGEDLLRPESLIPIRYLPDLFMAVPVWYFWADEGTGKLAAAQKTASDPTVSMKQAYFCDLFPTDRWTDTFLMYNRRMRLISDYKGDNIPPRIIARMRQLSTVFDHLVIMTPYHDVAGKDWSDVQWLRSIDPYVVGFKEGVPMMFILGRFSASGTFPLYTELVADTIAFLRSNIDRLNGFDRVSNPYWYRQGNTGYTRSSLGTYLIGHTTKLLDVYAAGNLFDWLRGEDGALPARA